MKRIALLLLVVLASTACASMTKGGARGPTIQRTDDTVQPSQPEAGLDKRVELGQL